MVLPMPFPLEQETAVNIAVSCRLVTNPDDVMVLNVDDKAESKWARTSRLSLLALGWLLMLAPHHFTHWGLLRLTWLPLPACLLRLDRPPPSSATRRPAAAAADANAKLDAFLRHVIKMYDADTGAEVWNSSAFTTGVRADALPSWPWLARLLGLPGSACMAAVSGVLAAPPGVAPLQAPLRGTPPLQLGNGKQQSPVDVVATIPAEWQRAELAVDGPSLTVVLQDAAMTHKLAVLAAHCSGVVVSRSSPSQKAAIVKMMKRYEQWKAAGSRRGLRRWYAMHKRRLQVGLGTAGPWWQGWPPGNVAVHRHAKDAARAVLPKALHPLSPPCRARCSPSATAPMMWPCCRLQMWAWASWARRAARR